MTDRRDVPDPQSLKYENNFEDKPAGSEAEAFSRQLNLEKISGDHARSEDARNLIASGIQVIVGVVIIILLVVLLVVAYHHLTPEGWHWLRDDRLAELRTILFSGAIVGAVSSYIQRHS